MSATVTATASHVLDAGCFPLWGSRLIEASAGTGKTWTIAALYLRLVLGHGEPQDGGGEGTAFERALMPPDILVMTFTRAATRELSDRIRRRLIEAVQCFRGQAEPAPHDDFLRALREDYPEGAVRERAAWRLAMAAECMDDAAIHTIDAWCQRMLREHAFDSGNLFDETLEPDESLRQTEAAQDYWRQQCYPLSDELLDAVLKIWPHVDALVEDMRALLREPAEPGAGEGSLGECLRRATGQRQAALLLLAEGWAGKAQRLQRWLDAQLDGQGALWDKRKLQPARYTGWLEALADWARAPLDTPLQLTEAARHRLSPEGLAEAFKGAPGDVLMPLELAQLQTLLVQLEQLPPVSVAVRLHAAARVSQRLALLKRQAGSFGFADMLQRLDTALAGDNGAVLRERILAQYPVALIDEFQDTSPLQYRLFDQIYRTAANDPHSALLLIGDPKQSIYGFRGADIHSYLQARRATEGRHYVLGTNYRSTEALVGAVNHWFAQAEQRPGEGAFMFRRGSANPLPFEPVAAQGRRERLHTREGEMPAITVAWSAGHDEDTGEPQPLPADEVRRRFAAHCAEQIVQWLADAQAGFVQPDGGFARLRPADIAILVRTGREAAAVRRELQARAVASVYLSDQDSVFASDEAHDLLYWLRAVAAPLDALAVRAGLATRLIGLSLDELARLAADEEAFDARSEQLRELHGVWLRQGVLAMLRQTLYRLDLPARWLRDPALGGERRLTNYLHLAELLQTASAQQEGEQALIRWLATQIEAPGSGSEEQVVRLESDADLVKVVTVHKSKGLEYPLVCLPFAGSFRPLERARTPYLSLASHEGEGEAATGRRLLLAYSDEELARADRDRLREDLRLFYVALTRPRHALWLGLAPLRRGGGKACVNEQGAAGYLLGGTGPRSAQGWLDALRQLCGDGGSMAWRDLDAVPLRCTRWQPPADAAPLLEAAPYDAHFDTRWGIGSFSALVRAMAAPSLPVLPVSVQRPAEDEQGLEPPSPDLHDMASMADRPQPAGAAVWHRFLRGPVVGNFVHEQLEWLGGEGFGLPMDGQGMLAQRLLRRCERAGRAEQAQDLLAWLTAVVHQPLAPLDVTLATLGPQLSEMEFWLPARQLPAERIDQLCRRFILPGQARPALPQRSLHGMLMGFADLVFCHEGRYWVLDYKSNHLGPDGSAYGAEALARAMLHHRYDVQAALYLLALHRLLRSRLGAAYAPQRQLGGALYYFLRGIDGPAGGLHVLAPEPDLLDALDDLLGLGQLEPEEKP
ncbi:Exodeoxyribonuclease V beta chain [Delftia tsuruhatensis]|uniref:exodeoxyribonuclease V subunit beta n=1 Tax=Delftia tsuruhatensis TaxID=180282 RepID=UPI001E7F2F71|nr:exodeoxyribonuclease V subunit beta [Delftia tsuruhatensis]CAB5697875.1 Exodeoxyribonuclease V beta chain [Delftia tsuruhatensis]CAC9676338.1 Exodeoxyribonuclease V beta chain [Delftia tsuruhatensis]